MNLNRLQTVGLWLAPCVVICLLMGVSASGQIPQLLNYQGRLTTAGTAIDTVVPILFTIYNDSLGANPLWSETHPAVNVEKGLFAVMLGSVTSLPDGLFGDSTRYLGIRIGDDPESVPLSRFASVAYAFKAVHTDTASYAHATEGSGWTDDGAVVRLTASGDKVGIGTSSPFYRVHITGSESSPLLNVEKTGSGRGMRVYTTSACAIWVANGGNHGLRVTHANGDGVHVTSAGGYAGWFNGKGYFSGNLGVGTLTPGEKLDVVGGSIRTDGRLISTVATGTPPLDVHSETQVANLNADMLDGHHAADLATAATETATVDNSSAVSISFSSATFTTPPDLSATVLVLSGTCIGSTAKIVNQSATSDGATLTLQGFNGSAFVDLAEFDEVQVSYTAVQ
ncbi:MAG: hypothetical protein OEV49_08930 [candidate division Zixibacteria bacterium]|nr:hypothetical protein [candidate division Zixibacteria bacterium]MDH3937277.1 hypothetical protein [candidate division Zixibacteria bacterium]MDH4032194.1 hypothetical protein [candidate division Zixibacteria bacterium]